MVGAGTRAFGSNPECFPERGPPANHSTRLRNRNENSGSRIAGMHNKSGIFTAQQ